ncbi:glycine rich protein [Artemisia annua]|uniref:Glycine rich protein n=1 Tax=Artemisia annua TaxID=35608 RepID=A0A2U1LZA4_ARTAN|nr:glycine rich protein [Artemisia annua]
MASKVFLLLALAFAAAILITSEVTAAKDLASNHDGEVDELGHGGYNNGGGSGGYNNGGGSGGYNNGGGSGGYNNGGGRCKYGCCGGGGYNNGGGCKCCATFAEATAYKQTQN